MSIEANPFMKPYWNMAEKRLGTPWHRFDELRYKLHDHLLHEERPGAPADFREIMGRPFEYQLLEVDRIPLARLAHACNLAVTYMDLSYGQMHSLLHRPEIFMVATPTDEFSGRPLPHQDRLVVHLPHLHDRHLEQLANSRRD